MANPGPAIAGIPNTELQLSTGPLQRVIFPTRATNGNAIGNGTLSFQYYPCVYPVTATRMDIIVNVLEATAATTATAAPALSVYGGIYSSSASTNTAGTTNILTLLSSGSTQTTYSYASNSAGNTQFSAAALRPLSIPININMSQPGEYFVAAGVSTTASSIGLSTTALALSMSVQADLDLMTATNYVDNMSVTATNASTGLYGGLGVYSAATAACPVSVNVTQINQTGANQLDGNFQFVMRNY